MTFYIAKRLAIGLLTIWGVVTAVFIVVRMAPGDQATVALGPDATTAEVEALRHSLGLDRPVLVQYVSYLGDVLRLDFGESYRFGRPAMDAVLERFPATITLTLTATVIAVAAGLLLGVLAGRNPGSVVDRAVSTFTLGLQAAPPFWVGIMLILVFALRLQVLPSANGGSLAHLVLPALTLSIPFTALVARMTRSGVADAMTEPFVQTARSKGLTEGQVLGGHVLKNSLVPVVTVVGLQVGTLLGGAVVIETVFAWPGLGLLLVGAVGNRDYAVVQAASVLIAMCVVLLNLAADVVNARLDPRIRLEVRR
ncbi:binding-protein-dependent transport systems inner membrane component [Beutenbergia cavernae DSM 12333]|uniref:Binding-protein-dependent transport systems inner membrane component n=1 Tax=Beutenbergia cavernae (strain ATCC BAA-8 / DSM 12333 / CCUG 43141 / JCM 11478 / NBRC 16432 / NCIMB 13614 / HKI 0122) TaxID=471853 RepID=C5C268_BEUC1|nr:ABC transporter permease [Beutenbergia cavernae]ACQ81693.1 binding-protein-dependent transport systems inner membrane component [Beutenbergia cavernae DSM 12333]